MLKSIAAISLMVAVALGGCGRADVEDESQVDLTDRAVDAAGSPDADASATNPAPIDASPPLDDTPVDDPMVNPMPDPNVATPDDNPSPQ